MGDRDVKAHIAEVFIFQDADQIAETEVFIAEVKEAVGDHQDAHGAGTPEEILIESGVEPIVAPGFDPFGDFGIEESFSVHGVFLFNLLVKRDARPKICMRCRQKGRAARQVAHIAEYPTRAAAIPGDRATAHWPFTFLAKSPKEPPEQVV